MTSAARILANQENAKASVGPSTFEGKARSSKNATKIGMTSNLLVLPGESTRKANALVRATQEHFGLSGPVGRQFAENLAIDLQKCQRIAMYEEGLVEKQQAEVEDVTRYEETKEILALKEDLAMVDMAVETASTDEVKLGQRSDAAIMMFTKTADKIVMRRHMIAGNSSPAIPLFQDDNLVLAMRGDCPRGKQVAVIEAASTALKTHREFLEEHIKVLEKKREEKIRLARQSSMIPDEKALNRLDKYRSMSERSLLRKLEILEKMKGLAAKPQ